MLKICLQTLVRPKSTSAAVASGFRSTTFLYKSQRAVRRSASGRVEVPSRKVGASLAACTLEATLEGWISEGERVNSQESLTRCLYRCLVAAQKQQVPSDQLLQVPNFRKFWQRLSDEVPLLPANEAVMCLYNCARYGFAEDPAVLSTLTATCLEKVDLIPPRAFGILLWSLCKLELYQANQALVTQVLLRFHSELVPERHFKPQAFANVLWALATTSTWPTSITSRVLWYVSERAADFDFHSLSIVLWSVTRAGLSLSTEFLEAAGDRAALLLNSQFQVVSLVHCCWAFGSAAYYHQNFFSVLTDKILSEPPRSDLFTPRLLSTVAWACARSGYYHTHLLDHVAHLSLSRMHHFNSQDLGNLAYSYGYLNHPSEQLLLAISDKMSSQEELARDELSSANVANACLIHKLYPEALLSKLMSHERVTALLQNGEKIHLHLCVQIHFLVKAERPELEQCMLKPPHDQMVPALAMADSMVNLSRVYSLFHQNMCKALLQITGSTQYFTREALTTFASFIDTEMLLDSEGKPIPIPSHWGGWQQPRKLLSAAFPEESNHLFWRGVSLFESEGGDLDRDAVEDVYVASDWADRLGGASKNVARKVAFEADGPKHYAVNCRHKLGQTAVKHRLLKAEGWDVIAIAHFDWEHLKSDQDHINYLASKLYNS